jgi:hypothetical protein
MSDIPGRIYKVAKSYLEAAKGRLEQIDSAAQAELSRALGRDFDNPYVSTASDDPMERARAKIAASRASAAVQGSSSAQSGTIAPTPQAAVDPVQTAYRVLGVPIGSDYAAVRTAVDKLRGRCSPDKFPAGSQEQTDAQTILARVEEAHQLLRRALASNTEERFNKLEI